ncbi:hypothetical protein LJR090_002548 [Bosea sp. LjRoot90]|uniref:hypothetical protein n=1 Tax=Bosea sp. LjRoot90 TaxID=3342342 RepID=UPI003ECE3301
MRLTRAFKGCRKGEVHPTQFQPGDECPPELEHAAEELDILETEAEFHKRQKAEIAETQKRLKAEQVEEQKRLDAEASAARLTELRALADQHNVDLGDADTEAKIVAALKKAEVEIPAA